MLYDMSCTLYLYFNYLSLSYAGRLPLGCYTDWHIRDYVARTIVPSAELYFCTLSPFVR